MINVFNCWVCNSKLETFSESLPFHCSQACAEKCKFLAYKPKDVWEEVNMKPSTVAGGNIHFATKQKNTNVKINKIIFFKKPATLKQEDKRL